MKNLNDINTKDMQHNLEGANQTAPSKSGTFMGWVLLSFIFLAFILMTFFIIHDDVRTGQQIQANYEKALNSPRMQELRAKQEQYQREEAKRQRELAKQKRLRQLGIYETAKPGEKNDLLNAKLKEARARQEQQKRFEEQKNIQDFNYSAELAAYNAKVQEIQAEEARLRAEQAAKIKAEQERIAARERADAEMRLKLKAEQQKIKAQQAKAAKNNAKTANKTEKKVLQTTKFNFGSGGSFSGSFGSNSSSQPK